MIMTCLAYCGMNEYPVFFKISKDAIPFHESNHWCFCGCTQTRKSGRSASALFLTAHKQLLRLLEHVRAKDIQFIVVVTRCQLTVTICACNGNICLLYVYSINLFRVWMCIAYGEYTYSVKKSLIAFESRSFNFSEVQHLQLWEVAAYTIVQRDRVAKREGKFTVFLGLALYPAGEHWIFRQFQCQILRGRWDTFTAVLFKVHGKDLFAKRRYVTPHRGWFCWILRSCHDLRTGTLFLTHWCLVLVVTICCPLGRVSLL